VPVRQAAGAWPLHRVFCIGGRVTITAAQLGYLLEGMVTENND
jgi:hypothetical protein